MLKPIDIQNKEFSRKINGYDRDEVDDFLDIIIKNYDALCKENMRLMDKVDMLNESLERYKQMEETMHKSVELAQQTAQDIKDNASVEAQALINKAKLDASRLARQIDEEHIRKHQEMLKIKEEIDTYKARIRTVCDNLIKTIDEA